MKRSIVAIVFGLLAIPTLARGHNGDLRQITGGMRAAGPCFDSTNRYVDCGNGTVTDTVTGLIWLKQWDCLGGATWAVANQGTAALKSGDCGNALNDGSSPGDWRLPTKAEWSATIARAAALGCHPSLTNDAGTACLSVGPSSFAGLAWEYEPYYSSTTDEASPTYVWYAALDWMRL